jgi:hypothetical protein
MQNDIICHVLSVLNCSVVGNYVYQRQDWQLMYVNKTYYKYTMKFLLDHLSSMCNQKLSCNEIRFFMTVQKKYCSVQTVTHPCFGSMREVVLSKKNCDKLLNFPQYSQDIHIYRILHNKIHGQISGKIEFVSMNAWFKFGVQTFPISFRLKLQTRQRLVLGAACC